MTGEGLSARSVGSVEPETEATFDGVRARVFGGEITGVRYGVNLEYV
jgi:hypothetical protein